MTPLPLATYGPWGNAQLSFTVSSPSISTDPATGNLVAETEQLEYLAALTIASPNWQKQEGVDMTTYRCSGRLLLPAVLDPRITNGSQAAAVINGYTGRFELVLGLEMDEAASPVIRQAISGTFRVIGGKQL